MRLSTGGFVTSDQFAVVKSEFCCKTKFVEGIIQERARLLDAGVMFICGVGMEYEV